METQRIGRLERGEVPLYVQLIRILRTQIKSGEYKAGDALPTEDLLSKSFGVSRITVRAALRTLAEEGVIARHSGKGTFVSEKLGLGASLAACTIDDLLYGGEETRRLNLGRKVVAASRGVAATLQVTPGAKVVQYRRVMFVDKTPLAHVTLTAPFSLCRTISEERLGQSTLILFLSEHYGVQLSAVEQWTTVSLADKMTAEVLQIAAGDPILLIERVFHDQDEQPIEIAVNRYRTDIYRHYLRLEHHPNTRVRKERIEDIGESFRRLPTGMRKPLRIESSLEK